LSKGGHFTFSASGAEEVLHAPAMCFSISSDLGSTVSLPRSDLQWGTH